MKRITRFRAIYGFIDFFILTFLIFDFGYIINEAYRPIKAYGFITLFILLLGFNISKFLLFKSKSDYRKTILVNMVILLLTLIVAVVKFILVAEMPFAEAYQKLKPIMSSGLFVYFIIRLMVFVRHIYNRYSNPTILFVGSFLALCLIGSFLLMLPKSTYGGISFEDALFTATSAVCVTGLTVMDTAKDFTLMGQTIILILFQLGGIGILTFTSFFSFFFKGSTSFREELYVKDFASSDQLQDALKMAMGIVVFTLSLEAAGAAYIYITTENIPANDRLFFAIFHSVSAFCNAGFSIFPSGLANHVVQFDYGLQWGIMMLIVLGGLGYNIVFNFFSYLKAFFVKVFKEHKKFRPTRIITLNTKIVFYSTLILLVSGFLFFLFAEQNYTLTSHQTWFGKLTTAAFNSVTTRTAGFNTVNFADMAMPSLLFVILLMWIGASPGSTGGGIKTTTFAIATLNIFSIARGKNHIEIGTREVSSGTVNRAFAIVAVSLITIGSGILLLLFFEPEKRLIDVVFECFSAYSTVGLSLGITPELSLQSKYVIILLMFVGRIGTLNLLFGMMRRVHTKFYKYPEENIFIN